jgi:hypothetical protein
MKSLLTALSVGVAALVLAAGAFSANGNRILGTEHQALHVEQIGPKYLTMDHVWILQTEHAALHLEQLGPKYLVVL